MLDSGSVSAGAKIPIVPAGNSPPLDVINRSRLRTEEVPRLVSVANATKESGRCLVGPSAEDLFCEKWGRKIIRAKSNTGAALRVIVRLGTQEYGQTILLIWGDFGRRFARKYTDITLAATTE